MSRRPAAAAAAAALMLATLVGCAPIPTPVPSADVPSPDVTASASPSAPVSASATPRAAAAPYDIVTGLNAPWSVVFVGTSALVSGRDDGVIREITQNGTQREVATIAGVSHGGEGGLLGLATDGRSLWVYSTAAGGNRVERYPITGPPGDISLGEPTVVIEGIPAATNHDGGRIAIGPDDMLYIATGDAGDRAAAQDPESLAGKILRLTPQGAIPADNPFEASPVYSLGHRNVQGIAWAADGRMYATEFGQNAKDELNRIEPGGNYGWPEVEGIGRDDDFIDPIAEWPTEDASPSGIAIVGATVYIANLRGTSLRTVNLIDPAQQSVHTGWGRLRDVVRAPDGRLWILTNNTDGRGDPRTGDDRIVSVAPDGLP